MKNIEQFKITVFFLQIIGTFGALLGGLGLFLLFVILSSSPINFSTYSHKDFLFIFLFFLFIISCYGNYLFLCFKKGARATWIGGIANNCMFILLVLFSFIYEYLLGSKRVTPTVIAVHLLLSLWFAFLLQLNAYCYKVVATTKLQE